MTYQEQQKLEAFMRRLQAIDSKLIEDNEVRKENMPLPRTKVTLANSNDTVDNKKLNLKEELQKRIIGQDHALDEIVSVFYRWEIGLSQPGASAGTFLLLGPTGSGKTRTIEALADSLFGNEKAFIKIDCAEFAHSHEIARLLGSPPGYLGHRETQPALTQENLNRYQSDKFKCSILLLDEIEKASDALWNLLLGVLDKATLTLGDNRKVDFSNTFIFMTSNLGAREMSSAVEGHMGFSHDTESHVAQKKLDDIALQAAKKRFTPEFLNRIDMKSVYRTLTKENLGVILNHLIRDLQVRLGNAKGVDAPQLFIPEEVRAFLLSEGVNRVYGARELKRTVERNLTVPITHLLREGVRLTGKVTLKEGKCKFQEEK